MTTMSRMRDMTGGEPLLAPRTDHDAIGAFRGAFADYLR